ncbi:MAG: type II secretion system F family protein [Candidatus Nezhaarchaeales archaeon]
MPKEGGMLDSIASFSYRLFKPKSDSPFIPLIKDKYLTAQINIPFPAYAAAIVMISIITCIVVAVTSFIIHSFILHFPLLFTVILTVTWSLIGFAIAFLMGVYYPSLRAKNLAFRIDKVLPYTVEYMAALASGGTTIETLIKRVAEVEEEKALRNVFNFALKQMRLFNVDPAASLLEAAKRSPSTHLRTLLEGLSTIISSSGEAASYLSDFAKKLVDLRRMTLRRILTSMSYISEIYVAIVVVGPAILITILLVIALLGYSLFGFDPATITMLMTFIGIPFLAAMVLIMMDRTLSSV